MKTEEGFIQGHVVMQNWQIANDSTAEIPHQGLLIVHLRAGALATRIGDGNEQQEWIEGSSWSVPAGERLIVLTARESAVLQTVEFITQGSPGEGAREPRRLVEFPPP